MKGHPISAGSAEGDDQLAADVQRERAAHFGKPQHAVRAQAADVHDGLLRAAGNCRHPPGGQSQVTHSILYAA